MRSAIVGLAMVAAIAASMPTAAQDGVVPHSDMICAFNGASLNEMGVKLGKPSPEAVKVIQWIVDLIGIENDFVVKSATFKRSPLAYAALSGGTERHVVYDVDLFLAKDGKLSFVDIFLLAHEVAHHINSDTSIFGRSKHMQELRADRYGGVIVNKLGGSLDDAIAVTKHFSKSGSKTHPPRSQRVQAIKEGWQHAERMRYVENGRCQAQWLGDAFEKEGQICRIAMRCHREGLPIKFACKNSEGSWTWR